MGGDGDSCPSVFGVEPPRQWSESVWGSPACLSPGCANLVSPRVKLARWKCLGGLPIVGKHVSEKADQDPTLFAGTPVDGVPRNRRCF